MPEPQAHQLHEAGHLVLPHALDGDAGPRRHDALDVAAVDDGQRAAALGVAGQLGPVVGLPALQDCGLLIQPVLDGLIFGLHHLRVWGEGGAGGTRQ